MNEKDLTNALDECLNAVDPVAAAKRWPLSETELLPLIRTAQLVRKVGRVVPSLQAKAGGLEQFLLAVRFKRRSRQGQSGLREAA